MPKSTHNPQRPQLFMKGSKPLYKKYVLEECLDSPTLNHHFLIPPPGNGLYAIGVCEHCGADREFCNALPGEMKEYERLERARRSVPRW